MALSRAKCALKENAFAAGYLSHRAFSDDVTSTILQLVPQNNNMSAMLGSQISPVVVDESFSYEKSFFRFNKFVWLVAT